MAGSVSWRISAYRSRALSFSAAGTDGTTRPRLVWAAMPRLTPSNETISCDATSQHVQRRRQFTCHEVSSHWPYSFTERTR